MTIRSGIILLLTLGVAAAQGPAELWRQFSPLSGRWWKTPYMVQKVDLTAEQQQKMDDIFQQNRVKLIDLTATLDKEEAILEPLMAAAQPDAAKIRPQIDRVATARAELEKANANMLLSMRLVLTQEQWKNLQGDGGSPRPRQPGPKRK
jgi:periplasmic protein CpxP/Spy